MINTTTAILALAILVVAFLIGSVTDLHMGIMAIVAAAITGPLVFQDSISRVQSGFPLGLFFTLMGVTYLFAIANNNGTVNWIVAQGLKLVAGRASLFPIVMFFIAAILTAIGCATPAAAAILMPIAMGFARQNNINPLPMAQAVIQGGSAGSFSPAGVYGAIINSVVKRSGQQLIDAYNPTITWAITFPLFFLVTVATWLIYKQAGPSEAQAAAAETDDSVDLEGSEAALVDEEFGDMSGKNRIDYSKITLNPERTATVVGIGIMAALVVISSVLDLTAMFGRSFGTFDVGLTSLAVGVVLTLAFPKGAKGAVNQIAWPTILLVGGIVTYIAMLERHGIIKWLGDLAAGLGNPRISSMLILFLGALVSAFASTTGILGALIPLSVPFLVGPTAAVSATMLIAGLAVSSSTVDCSPFSTNGALAVANAAHQGTYVYKKIFVLAWVLIFATPLVTWALFILPPWGGN